MLTLNMLLNMMFLLMKHPLSMGMTIIMQTMVIMVMTGMMFKSFWFSYILFLMYIGGMMVLFIYMTSLVPNMMFKMSYKNMFMMMSAMMLIIMMKKNNMMMNYDMMIEINSNMLMKMYSSPSNMLIMLMAMYLFFTMITVFKITEMNKGPLQMMN
uniref:NADH-ubiquinone oxidoreductase chain 6 n=1 Tax=Phraortes sp. Iriomote Island TaxID=590991 RepID=E2RUW7_9NEOP|nr:NADH dehydrogenase subunit 6 [Phraortes sp. Iriomote Island]BAJ24501.1 NADH dehydrogenase subunit 6 [Phraortes sp. Iriomote Island]